MKKYHLYLWFIALVGLMTSCSQDETDALQTATESNRVTLTASLPEDFAQIGTRALPTAPTDDYTLRCILEVWTRDASPALKYREEKVKLTGDNIVFDFKIDKGTYDCLFWADFIEKGVALEDVSIGGMDILHYKDKFYVTNNPSDGLKAISIIRRAYVFNTDVRDAFFGHYKLEKDAAAVTNPSIPALTRPFAKLTIKEKDVTNYSYCSGLEAKYSVPAMFNVLNGTVDSDQSSTIELYLSGKSNEPQTLFSDYIFTNASSTLGSISLTFTGTTGKELQPVDIPAGIPLKRNYKTNATGSLISEKLEPIKDVKLTVTMDAGWTGTEEKIISANAKVGDYYYKDGTWSTENKETDGNPILGVVYKVNADGSGKVVSLTEQTGLKWGPKDVTTGATSGTSGKENTDMIFTKVSEGTYTLSDYPIFNACQELRTSTGNNGWCVPAYREYIDLFKVVSTINNKITAISGTTLFIPSNYSDGYWTSTEMTSNTANLMMSDSSAGAMNKDLSHKVRFMLDF